MKFTIYPIFLFLLISSSIFGQKITIEKDSIYSQILKENRNLIIYLPSELAENKPKQKTYPVLYVLDGDSNYQAISGMIQYLTEVNGNKVFPKMIVVFIPNTNRTRDLTPYKAKESSILSKQMAEETGGGEVFSQVIEKEIIPHINSKYPTSDYRALVGHSFGGIFALSILANHPHLFEDYLVMDPSLWYDDQKFSRKTLQKIIETPLKGKSLFISIANTTFEKDLNKVLESKASFAIHEKSIIQFCRKLHQNKLKSIRFNYQYYPNDDHSSVPFAGVYDGLRKIFDEYQLSPYEVIKPNFNPEKRILDQYEKLSNKVKTTLKVTSEELEYFDRMYQINQDKLGANKLKQLYKKLYPEEYTKYIQKMAKK